MLTAIYTSMSGMTAFETGLTLIGNNVANLNTPGFKGTEPVFSDVAAQQDAGALPGSPGSPSPGGGVTVNSQNASFAQGQLEQTGNPLDAGIQGEGFFVLQQNGSYQYTRAGQFQIDSNGDLVSTGTHAHVMVSTAASAIGPFNINSYLSYAPQATQNVYLTGNLAATGQTGPYTLPGITVNDGSGGTETLSATFTQSASNPQQWSVTVNDAGNHAVGSGTVTFGSNGTPTDTPAQIQVTVTPANQSAFTVDLNLGSAGSFSGVTSIANNAASQVQVRAQDGVAMGVLTQTSFDSRGNITLTYSNSKTLTPAKLVLAQFQAPQQLHALGNGLYATVGDTQPVLGSALTTSFGSISDGELEMSNVDLTKQLTQLILLQRGYQASSQITSVANDMMQQLLTMAAQR